jgi:transposase
MIEKSKPERKTTSKEAEKSTQASKSTGRVTQRRSSKNGSKTNVKAKETNTPNNIKKKEAFLEALELNMGIVSQACKAAGIGRTTVYDWRKADEAFASAMDEINEIVYDFAESKILEQIREGNTAVLIFYAKTKMKSRGYIERQEIAVSDAPAFVIKGNPEAASRVINMIKEKHGKTGS